MQADTREVEASIQRQVAMDPTTTFFFLYTRLCIVSRRQPSHDLMPDGKMLAWMAWMNRFRLFPDNPPPSPPRLTVNDVQRVIECLRENPRRFRTLTISGYSLRL